MVVKLTLKETLEGKGRDKLTRNAIAVKAGVRPATLHDMVNKSTKSISLETLNKIIDAMNQLDSENIYDISDIIIYENTKKDA